MTTIFGTIDDDTLIGTLLGEDIFAKDGNDTVYGGDGDDLVSGAEGNDSLYGGDGKDVISGAEGTDLLSGGAGNDGLSGGSGIDIIDGGTGDDFIVGGLGKDTLTGGSGANSFWWYSRGEGGAGDFGRDIITDFKPGSDTIHLLTFKIPATDLQFSALDGGTSTMAWIDFDHNGTHDFEIQFNNVAFGTLHTSDFAF